MSLLNLTLGEFLAIFLPIAAAVVALYLYDRAHRRQVVSTLRFFQRVKASPVFTRRKKIQQPWSLLLQLVSLALLLLAIAELQLGGRGQRARDHVLILETSAWMNSASPGNSAGARPSLMQVARRRALDYLRAVPSQDRVLLIRADQLATPVTPFTRNRKELEAAIRASDAGSTALNLSAALELARNSQHRAGSGASGEIVIVGSGWLVPGDAEKTAGADFANVRTILLDAEPNNCGIRKLSARRSPADPSLWEIDVGAYNYGAAERRLTLTLTFAGPRIASKALALAPHSAAEASFQFRSSRAGLLEAVLDAKDDFRADNRAAVELPKLTPLKVQVFTSKPALWQPLLTASAFIDAEFHRPNDYTPGGAPHRLVILDGFRPSSAPNADAIWIAPQEATRRSGPLHVRRWNGTHPITAGLHNRDVRVNSTAILEAKPQEAVIAECDGGPVLLASAEGAFKRVVFAFHPLQEGVEDHVAIPLLFANLVRWVSPELFRSTEISAGAPGLVELETPSGTQREQVQVASPQIRNLAFTLVGNRLRFFTGQAGTVRVTTPEQERIYMLSLPEVGEVRWTPPPGVRHGVPPPSSASGRGINLWPWLALAGALGLLAEWILYGRRPAIAAAAAERVSAVPQMEPSPTTEPAVEEVRS